MSVERISPEETKEKLESGEDYVYLDVRTVEEFAEGHVPGAYNVPVMMSDPMGMGMAANPEFVDVVEANFPKDAKIITGCLRGGRSMKAAQALQIAGFTNVVDMRGGFDGEMGPGGMSYEGWSRRGLPVSTEPANGATYGELKATKD